MCRTRKKRGQQRKGKEGRERTEEEEQEEAARIEQVCKEEIRALQVSLQDCYIDLREKVQDKEVGREFHFIISNAALCQLCVL